MPRRCRDAGASCCLRIVREAVSGCQTSCQGCPWTSTEVLRRPTLYSECGAEGQDRTVDTRFFRPVLYQLSYLGDPRRSVAAPPRRSRWRVWSTAAPVQSKHGPGHPRSRARGRSSRPGSITGPVRRAHQQPGMARPAPLAGRCRFDRPLRPTLLRSGAGRRSPRRPARGRPLRGGFIRVAGDETDALALVFVLRDLSERFSCRVGIRDPDNPIAKLRTVDLVNGRLADRRALESILVRRPIFKRSAGRQPDRDVPAARARAAPSARSKAPTASAAPGASLSTACADSCPQLPRGRGGSASASGARLRFLE